MRTRLTLRRLAITLSALLALPAAAQPSVLPVSADPELASLAASWEELAEKFFVPGTAVAMIKDGKT